MRTWLSLVPFAVVAVAGCRLGGGGGAATSVTHRLDPYGISIDLSAAHTGGATPTGYSSTSGDGSSVVQVATWAGRAGGRRE